MGVRAARAGVAVDAPDRRESGHHVIQNDESERRVLMDDLSSSAPASRVCSQRASRSEKTRNYFQGLRTLALGRLARMSIATRRSV